MKQLEYRLKFDGKDFLQLSIQNLMKEFKYSNADLKDFFKIVEKVANID